MFPRQITIRDGRIATIRRVCEDDTAAAVRRQLSIPIQVYKWLLALSLILMILLANCGCQRKSAGGVTTVRFVLTNAEPNLEMPQFIGFTNFSASIPRDIPATKEQVDLFMQDCDFDDGLAFGTPRSTGDNRWVFYVNPVGGSKVVVEIPDHTGQIREWTVSSATGFNVEIFESSSNVEVVVP